jgi:DUF2950 family protein
VHVIDISSDRTHHIKGRVAGVRAAVTFVCAMLGALAACTAAAPAQHRTFSSPEEAVRALVDATKAGNVQQVVAIFGPDGQQLVDSSDATTARRNREVFVAAVAEHWQLADQPNGGKVLVIGNEGWPFPVPLTKDAGGWRFDTAAGQ